MSKLVLSYVFKTNLAEFRSAIINDDTDKICRILDIEHDCLHKYVDSKGNTPLTLAIECASPLTVRLLLEQGAQADQANRISCRTPLALIASKRYENYSSNQAHKQLEMAKILLDHGVYVDKPSISIYHDENNKDFVGKETALMISVRKRNLPLAKLLIERKANVNYIERQSKLRPIHFAITNGDEAMYDLLDSAGAVDPSIVTSGGNTLLHWFCYNKENDEEINLLKKLINKGCDINAENTDRRTPLMIAAKTNMNETCRLLLEHGAHFDKRDSKGNQAIDLTIPGSACSKVILTQTQLTPVNKTKEKILWRKRIDSTHRPSSILSGLEPDQINNQWHPAKTFDHDNEHSHEYINSVQRKKSEQLEKRQERAREKFRQNNTKRNIFQNLYKQITIDR